MAVRACRLPGSSLLPALCVLALSVSMTGCALFYGSDRSTAPAVAVYANPKAVARGTSATLTVTALNVAQITITGSDGSSFTLPGTGGTQTVGPSQTTRYTATGTGTNGTATATTTLVVSTGNFYSLNHVIFLLQENHTFDNYFGMLNPYRKQNGWNVGDDGNDYEVDGIDDKLTSISNEDDEGQTFSLFKFKSTCIDDETSDWLASYGDANRYDFSNSRKILMDGFVHNAEGYAKACSKSGPGNDICAGSFTDLAGKRSMGYYDQDFLNYYYYMASQFSISDRWFSPVSSKSVDNRIATFTGGTTQGLVKDPGGDDKLPQLYIGTIFQKLDAAHVSWKLYYIATQGGCGAGQPCTGLPNAPYPATDFSNLIYSKTYLYENPSGQACIAPTQASSVVGDTSNSFCIDPTHISPIANYFTDLTNATLPSFAFIEAGYGFSDEHPGSGQSILVGQAQVASLVNALMQSPSWFDSVFFLAYDEGGGPYDHVPPVPGHSNDFTDASITAGDISSIAVNPDSFNPCVPPTSTATRHCDLAPTDPGAKPTDAAAVHGFSAQLGFRVPNIVISPFVRKHYVSHIPMDHTAVIRFVENRFLGGTSMTGRDAAQPNLFDFFDFNTIPWLTPPNPPAAVTKSSLSSDPCTPDNLGP